MKCIALEKLEKAQARVRSRLCVGLDTTIEHLPKDFEKNLKGISRLNAEIIDITKDVAGVFKINVAFYEQFGANGWDAMKETLSMIPRDCFVIADAKRGDLGNTSVAYANAFFNVLGFDAVTVHPYMGEDSISPWLNYEDKMVFMLALTSNPSSAEFQRSLIQIDDDQTIPLYQHIVKTSLTWKNSDRLGYVVGATHPREIAKIRAVTPNSPLLFPGVGAQGGSVAETLRANGNAPATISVSRAIIDVSSASDYRSTIAETANSFATQMKLPL